MNLAEMGDAYIDDGYKYEAAATRSCQDYNGKRIHVTVADGAATP